MSNDEELKWMTKRYSWRYIPHRYQAMVATIFSAFVYFDAFKLVADFRKVSGLICEPDSSYCKYSFSDYITQLVACAAGLAIAGFVLRRAIKREATASQTPS